MSQPNLSSTPVQPAYTNAHTPLLTGEMQLINHVPPRTRNQGAGMKTLIEHAKHMTFCGGYVFPCNGKQPQVPRGVSWKDVATNNPEHVAQTLQGAASYGVWGGTGTGLLTIDDDRGGNGFKQFHTEHLKRDVAQYATFTVKTPGQGFHYYYRVTAAQRATIGDTHALKKYGIDVKGHGYVIGPGSKHPNGGTYEIHVSQPVANLPHDMFDAIQALMRPTQPVARDVGMFTLRNPANVTSRDLAYVRGAVNGVIADLRAAPSTPGVEPRWQQLCFSKACKFIELANSGIGLTHEEALQVFMDNAPKDKNHGSTQLTHYWTSALARVANTTAVLPTREWGAHGA